MFIRLAMNFKKGFITIYFTSMLLLIMTFCLIFTESAKQYLYFRENLDAFRRMNNAEILTVLRIKKAFQEYRENDEMLTYKGCIINISYDGLKAEFSISYQGYLRERKLEFDETSQTIKEYH